MNTYSNNLSLMQKVSVKVYIDVFLGQGISSSFLATFLYTATFIVPQ